MNATGIAATATPTELETKPEDQLGIWMTSSIVVGSMIGAGIFLLPVALAPLGINAIAGWVISSIGALCIAFSLAQLTRAGGAGIQAHIEDAFGPTVAYLVAWSFWTSNWAGNAGLAIAFAAALSWISPGFGGPWFVVVVAVAAVVALTLVNASGVRSAGGLALVTVAIKLFPLVAVMAIMVIHGLKGAFQPLPPVPLNVPNVASAAALTLFAMTGFENATTPVDKVRNASRTLPLAIMGGTTFVALLYLLSSSSIQLLLPASIIAGSGAPYADVISAQWGRAPATFAAVAIAISAFGCLNCLILATGELGFSMAQRGDLPRALARTRGANTPVVAQLVGSALTILLILANSSRATAGLFTFVILLSTAGVLVLYGVGALAAWKQSRAPGQRAATIIALIFVAFAFYGVGAEAAGWSLVLLAIGYVLRLVMRRLNSRAASPAAAADPAVLPESSS
jgi:APA family basic amino acid/polyamine antiporter